jgi:pyridoxamine 5'-phosphate oxidase
LRGNNVELSNVAEPASERRFDPENAADPIELFQSWFRDAARTEPNDPDAAALATATLDGAPSIRMVLVKRADASGFYFFTNAESQKGRELEENPRAALCFHWKTQRRQLRVEGSVNQIPAVDADAYFHTRSRRSQIGAAVSAQSRPLDSRETLLKAVREFEATCPDSVPRPSYWRGYVLKPQQIEFWQDGEFRLHNRMLYSCEGDTWTKLRLYP